MLCAVLVSFGFFLNSCGKNISCPKAQIVNSNPIDPVLVVVNGQSITQSELQKTLTGRDKGALLKAENEMYEAKMGILQEYVSQKLIEEEAKKKNLTTEEYLKKELEGKIKPVKDKEIQDFYNNAKGQLEKGGKKVPPLNDEVKAQIKKQLSMQGMMERKEALDQELFKKNSVTFALEQPRVEVQVGDHPARGAENAKVTIVEFSDYQCPYCKKGASTMKDVMKKYPSKVKYYFRDYPLPFHDRAKAAANASRCAGEQGRFWEFHDKAFEDQSKLSDEDMIAIGKSLNLDMAKYEPCVKEMKMLAAVEKDHAAGDDAGVSGTPAYFINGIFLSGALPLKKFEEVIDAELKK